MVCISLILLIKPSTHTYTTMNLISVFCALSTLASTAVSFNVHDQVLQSRVTVGQCRAICMDNNSDDSCDQQCATDCWAHCAKLQEFSTQQDQLSGMCQESSDCGPGCQLACSSFLNTNSVFSPSSQRQRRRSRARLEFSTVPVLTGCSLSWGELKQSANSFIKSAQVTKPTSVVEPVVFLVLGRDRAGTWYEVNQTLATEANIQPWTLGKLQYIHIIGVGKSGVLAAKTVPVPAYIPRTCVLQTAEDIHVDSDDTIEDNIVDETFRIDLVGIEKLDGIPRVVIAWQDHPEDLVSAGESKYLVRWRQIPAGPVTGNMMTNSSMAKLPLLSTADVLVEVTRLAAAGSSASIYINKLEQYLAAANKTQDSRFTLESPAVIISIVSSCLSFILILVLVLRSKCSRKQTTSPCDVEKNNACNTIYGSKLESDKCVKAFISEPAFSKLDPTANLDLLNFTPSKLKNVNIFDQDFLDKKFNN